MKMQNTNKWSNLNRFYKNLSWLFSVSPFMTYKNKKLKNGKYTEMWNTTQHKNPNVKEQETIPPIDLLCEILFPSFYE